MNTKILQKNKFNNMIHSAVLLVSMASLMGMVGWMIGGGAGIALAGIVGLLFSLFNPYTSSSYILKKSNAQLLHPLHFPELNHMVNTLARRAGLPHTPRLYCMSSQIPNAFVVGREEDSNIVVTDSLLRGFNSQEIAGILGHEVAHIRNKDLLVMNIAGVSVQITQLLSTVGQVSLLLALPVILMGKFHVALFPFMVLVFAPTLAILLQLALSRTREFEADVIGAQLCGDVYGLASALHKLERYRQGLWRRIVYAPWRGPQSPLLQTHPKTADRIKKLLGLAENNTAQKGISKTQIGPGQNFLKTCLGSIS